jgi:hypothetical protein
MGTCVIAKARPGPRPLVRVMSLPLTLASSPAKRPTQRNARGRRLMVNFPHRAGARSATARRGRARHSASRPCGPPAWCSKRLRAPSGRQCWCCRRSFTCRGSASSRPICHSGDDRRPAAVSGEPWVSGQPDRLRLGDVVRFDGDSHEIVGFDGAAAILSTPAGRTSVVTIAALWATAEYPGAGAVAGGACQRGPRWYACRLGIGHAAAAPARRELHDVASTRVGRGRRIATPAATDGAEGVATVLLSICARR